MNKKGFTLIELIGSIIILVMIALIVFPSVLNTFNQKNNEIDEASQKTLKLAALEYVNDNLNDYSKTSDLEKYIDYCTLYKNGYVKYDEDLINSRVKITSNGTKYITTFENSGSSAECEI